MRATYVVLAAAALALACAPARDHDVRRARLASERRNLDATLDALEARLHATRARVRFWQEIRERHESVSAVACVSAAEHAEEMARNLLPRSSLHRARIAAVASEDGAPVREPAATRAAAPRELAP